MAAAGGKTFAEATAIKALSSHTYEAEFADDWCIGSVPHGGYVTSTFQRVASLHFSSTLSPQSQPDTIALHLSFLRRTQAGRALFTVQDTKLGRLTSVIHISLSQPSSSPSPSSSSSSSEELVVGYITHTSLTHLTGVTLPTSWVLPHAPPPPVSLPLLSLNTDPNWVRQPEMPFSAFRKASGKTEFYFPRGGQSVRSRADEWIRLRSGERWRGEMLGYVVDMWPMPVEALMGGRNVYDVVDNKGVEMKKQTPTTSTAKMWYPTLLLNLDIKKALPEQGVEWLQVRVEAKTIADGRMDLEVVVLDEGGEVVALSQHVAFAVDASRNLAERRRGKRVVRIGEESKM